MVGKFKVGDIIIGTSTKYSYTGRGSICKVLTLNYNNRGFIEVFTLKPTPRKFSEEEIKQGSVNFVVGAEDFILAPNPLAVKALFDSE